MAGGSGPLAKLEAEHGELNQEIKKKRLELPWVPVEKEYVFDTQDGKKSLASFSTAARSYWPTTSCTARITSAELAPAARASATSSAARST